MTHRRGRADKHGDYMATHPVIASLRMCNFAAGREYSLVNHAARKDGRCSSLWDYDAPDTPQTPRDASAAAITASALIELSTLVEDGQAYMEYAGKLLKSLSSDGYLAKPGTNRGFVLMHSTGSLPNGSEIDTPLNYADYYYLEALLRYMQVKEIDYKHI